MNKSKAQYNFPDPSNWVDDGRVYLKYQKRCKICNSFHRGLIEDLITDPSCVETRLIEWANEHKLFCPPLSAINLYGHKKKHMGARDFPLKPAKNAPVQTREYSLVYNEIAVLSDVQKLDIIANRNLTDYVVFGKPPSVAIDAIRAKGSIPKDLAIATALRVFASSMVKGGTKLSGLESRGVKEALVVEGECG